MFRNTEPEQNKSAAWSVLSLISPLCSIAIALYFKANPHQGNGNLEIFSPELLVIVLSCLGFGVVGIVFGLIGLTKGRWPIIAFVGLILSGLLLLGPFIH